MWSQTLGPSVYANIIFSNSFNLQQKSFCSFTDHEKWSLCKKKKKKKAEESIMVSSSHQGLNQAVNSHIWTNTHLCFSVKKLFCSWHLAMCKHKRAFLNFSKMQNVLLKISTFFILKALRTFLCLFFWAHYGATTATFKCINSAFRPRFVTKEMVLLICILGAQI